jgi:Fusaric acid resistance protein-like
MPGIHRSQRNTNSEPRAEDPARPPGAPPNIAWNWTDATLGAIYALPGAIVVLSDPVKGFGFTVGVLPAAILGLAPTRKGRARSVSVGVLAGVSIFIGSALEGIPVLAVVAIAVLAIGATWLAARAPVGQLVLFFSLPMIGIGLSFTAGKGGTVALLMIAGSLYACAVSLLWPERAPPRARAGPTATPGATLDYGIRLGLAGAIAAAIGFIFDLDHVGWACAAALLVMRPVAEMQRLRSVGRVCAVVIGAVAGILLVQLNPTHAVYALAAIAALAGAGGTHGSRWYVTPAFTTFLVFLLLLASDPASAGSRFGERVLETLLGVGLAYLFGLALPSLLEGDHDTEAETEAETETA